MSPVMQAWLKDDLEHIKQTLSCAVIGLDRNRPDEALIHLQSAAQLLQGRIRQLTEDIEMESNKNKAEGA